MFAKKKIEFYSQKKNKFSSLPKKWTKKVMIDKKKIEEKEFSFSTKNGQNPLKR